jgi:hypothetical protein
VTTKDKEFYELRNQFEKDMKQLIYGHRLDRANNIPTGNFYDDGYVNTLFHSYMLGYENAKCLSRLGTI